MYAITGITGKVGGEVAGILTQSGRALRAVVRDPRKGAIWADLGCEVAVAEMNDTAALTTAFSETAGVFVLLPPVFDPLPDFPETRATIAAPRQALENARPEQTVCISTIGAQAKRESLLTQLTLMERALADLPTPITFLRPAWFMENCSWDVVPARDTNTIASFLQPLDKPFPIVATADIGHVAAELLQENSTGPQIIELEGRDRISPNQIVQAVHLHRAMMDRGIGRFRSRYRRDNSRSHSECHQRSGQKRLEHDELHSHFSGWDVRVTRPKRLNRQNNDGRLGRLSNLSNVFQWLQ